VARLRSPCSVVNLVEYFLLPGPPRLSGACRHFVGARSAEHTGVRAGRRGCRRRDEHGCRRRCGGVAAHAHAHAGAGGKSPDSSLQGAKRRLIRIANQCGLPVSWSIVFGCEPVRSTVHLLLALVVACVSVPTLWAPRRVSCVACGARGRGKQRARLGDVGSGATKRCRLATQGHHSHTQVL
jgi:hypothetical protein